MRVRGVREVGTGSTFSLTGVAAVVGFLALGGCGADRAGGGAGTVVRDSAGVRIVENPGHGSWSPDEAWRLEEDLRIGVAFGDPELEFGSVAGLDADPNGRIYALDGHVGRVRVFDPVGGLVTAFGSLGAGPGEIAASGGTAPDRLFLVGDREVAVADGGNQRVTRFDRQGTVLSPVPFPLADGFPVTWNRSADGVVYRQVQEMALPGTGGEEPPLYRLARVDLTAGTEDAVLTHPAPLPPVPVGGGVPRLRMLEPTLAWSPLSNGRVAFSSSESYTILVQVPEGDVETIIRMAVPRRTVSTTDREAVQRVFSDAFARTAAPAGVVAQVVESMDFPTEWPALAAMLEGPAGTLWVQRMRPDDDPAELTEMSFRARRMGGSRWDVFDRDGEHLGLVQVPPDLTPVRFVGDDLYAVHHDELEIERAVRLRVVR